MMSRIYLYILFLLVALGHTSVLMGQVVYSYNMDVEFRNANIQEEAGEKYFVADVYLRATNMPANYNFFTRLQLVFDFNRECFDITHNGTEIQFIPAKPEFDLPVDGFLPYTKKVHTFVKLPDCRAQVFYTDGFESDIRAYNLVWSTTELEHYGQIKWKLLPGAAGKTGIKVRKEGVDIDDFSAANVMVRKLTPIRLDFSGCSLDIEIPGTKPVVASPVFAANQDTVICKPPKSSSYALEGNTLPTKSDNCVWYVSSQPKGAMVSDVADVTLIGKGEGAKVAWKTTQEDKTYYLNVYSMSGGYSSDTVYKKIRVIGFPPANITETTLCRNELSCSTLAGSTFTWWNAGYTTSSTSMPYNPTESGYHHLVRELETCRDTAHYNVTKLVNVIAWAEGFAPPATCDVTKNAPLIISVDNPSAQAGDDYVWVKPTKEVAGANGVSFHPNGDIGIDLAKMSVASMDFEVYMMRGADCKSNILTGTTTFTNMEMQVKIDELGGSALCSGGAVLLSVSVTRGTSPYTYAWYKSGNSNPISTDSIFAATASGDYTVKVTDKNNTTVTSDVKTINGDYLGKQAPIIAGSSQIILSATSTVLAPKLVSGTPTQWVWNPSALLTSAGQYPNTVPLTANQTFKVFVKDAEGCTSNMADVKVTVLKPTDPGWNGDKWAIAVKPKNTTVCKGNTVELAVEATEGTLDGATYEWLSPQGKLSNTDKAIAIYTASAPITADECVIRVTKSGVSIVAKANITVNNSEAPVLALKNAGEVTCSGDTVAVVNLGNIKPTSYEWYINNDPVVTNTDSTYVLSASGNHNIRVVGKSNVASTCASDTLKFNKTIGVGAQLVNLTRTLITCDAKGTLKFDNITPTNAPFAWLKPDKTLLSSTDKSIEITNSGTYYITYGSGECADTIEIPVLLNNAIVVNGLGNLITSCGTTADLKFTSTSAADFKWLASDKTLISGSENKNPQPVSQSGIYYLALDGGACKDTLEVMVALESSPVVEVEKIQTTCGSSHTLLAGASAGTVHWLKADNSKLLNTEISGVSGTPQYYKVFAQEQTCFSDTVDVTVNFGTKPSVNVVTPQTSCGTSVTLKGTSTGGNIVWLGTDKKTVLTNTTVATAGTYYAYAQDGTCQSADTAEVSVNFGVAPVLTVEPIQTSCNATHTLYAATSGGTIQWLASNNSLLGSPTISRGSEQVQTYKVYAKDNSCFSDTVDVTVNFGTKPSVNVVTPQTSCGTSVTLKGTSTGGNIVWLGTDKKTILTNTTVATAGTYYAYAQDGTCQSADTAEVSVNFGVAPVLTVEPIQTSCNATHTLYAETSGGTIQWLASNNTLLGSPTISRGSEQVQSYKVYAKDNSCFSDTVDVTVNFGTLPSVNVVTPQTSCGTSVTLKGTSTGGNIVWLGTDKKTILTNSTVTTAGTYYAYAQDGTCQSADTAEVSVNFGVAPVLTVEPIQTSCNATHTLYAETSGGTIQWLASDNTLLGSPTIIRGSEQVQTYKVYAKDNSCFSDTVDVTVNFGTKPLVNVVTPQTSCGTSVTLKGTSTGGNIVWLGTDKKTILTNSTVTTAGTYYAYAQDGTCQSADTAEISVNFGVAPVLTVEPIQTSCNATHTLYAETSGGTIQWLASDNTLLGSPTISRGSEQVQTYKVYAKDNSCFSDTVDVTVNFGTLPSVNVVTPQTSCGTSVTLKGTSTGGNIVWLGTDKKTILTNSTVTTAGTYYAYAQDGTCHSADTAEVSVNFGVAPVLTVEPIQTSCNATHTLYAETSGGTIQWLASDNTLLGSPTISRGSEQVQTYKVYAKDNSCFSDTVDVTVNFGTLPSVNVVTPQTSCGTSVTLKGTSTGGNIVWLGTDKKTILTNSTVTTAGTYYAYAQDGTCQSADTAEVSVNFGVAPVLTVEPIQTSCNATHTLYAETSGGTIQWLASDNTLLGSPTISRGSEQVQTYKVYAKDNSCFSDTVDVTVNFGTKPLVNVVTPQTSCGTSLTLSGTATGGNLVWLNTDKTTILTNLTVATAGTYYAYAKDGSCQSVDTAEVVISFGVPPILTVDKNQTSCNLTHELLATTSGGKVVWSDGTTILTTTTVTGLPGTTQTYSVIATDGSCYSKTETVTVTFGAQPIVTVTSPQTSCGTSLTLSAATSGGTLIWLDKDNLTPLSDLTVKDAGPYFVYAKDGTCIGTKKTVDVQLNTTPTVTVNPEQMACGTTHLLTATTSGGTLHWLSGGTEITNLTITGSLGETKIFEVFVKDKGCESVKQEVKVTFGSEPTIMLSEISCLGDTLWVEGDQLDSYRWSIDGTLKQSGDKAYYVFTAPGTYTVNCVGTLGTCESNSETKTMQINARPTIEWVTKPKTSVFAGEMLTGCVSAQGGTAPYSYAWSVAGSNNACITVQAVDQEYDFQAYVTDAYGCMSDTTTNVHVKVEGFGTLLNVGITSIGGNDICKNGAAVLSAGVTGGVAPYTYEWYEKGTPDKLVRKVTLNSPEDVLTMSTPSAGTYMVKVKDGAIPMSLGDAEIILTKTETNTAPVANAGSDLMVKTGEKAVLLGSATGVGEYQWHWSPVNLLNDATEATKQHPLTAKLTEKKEFSLYVVDKNSCVSLADTMVVNVSTGGVKLQVFPATATLCQGNTQLLRLEATPQVADADITWSPAAGLSTINNDSTLFTSTASGDYTFIAKVVVSGNIYTARTEITVNSGTAPIFTIDPAGGVLCQSDTLRVKYAADAERATNYSWTVGGVQVSSDSFYVVNKTGTYDVKVAGASGSCAATEKTTSVTVNATPVITSLQLLDSCAQGIVEVVGSGNYTWTTTSTGKVDAKNSNRYIVTAPGDFQVTVTTALGSCTSKKQINGTVHTRPALGDWVTPPLSTPYDPGDNLTVTVAASGGVSPYTYHWLQPTVVSEIAGQYSLLNVSLANYTFEVYAVDENGCASEDTLKAGISVAGGTLKVTLASNYGTEVCKDGYALLTANVEGATTPCTFAWYKGADVVNAKKESIVNALYDTLWVAAADVDKYTVKVNADSKQGEANITLTASTTKTAPVVTAGPDMTIPSGKLTALLGEITTAGTPSYQWHWSPADKLSVLADTATQFPLTAALTAQQSYSVYVVDANNCVSRPDAVVVNVNDTKGLCLTVTPQNKEICRGNTVLFESEVTCGTVTGTAVYSWLPTSNITTTGASARFTPTTNGVFEYAVSVSEGGVSAAARVKVTVTDADAPKLDITGRSDCMNDTLIVTNSGALEKEYIWTVDGIVISEKSNNFVLNTKNIKNVMVYATADNGCSSDTVNRTMNLGVIPPVNITEGSFAEYKDSVFVLNVDNDPLLTSGGYDFTWSSLPNSKINGTVNQLLMTSEPMSEDTRYVFTATDKTNAVCQGTDTVTAYLIPNAPKVDINKDASNNIVLSWDPLVNADSARIMFNKWDGYGVASSYKMRQMNLATVTDYTVDVSNDTLEFFYVNASRYVAELDKSYHSHASDTVGYFKQWILGNAIASTQINYIAYPFDMSMRGVNTLGQLGDYMKINAVGNKLAYYDYNSEQWKDIQYMSSGGGRWMSASNALKNIYPGLVYRIQPRFEGENMIIFYGKLPNRFIYNIDQLVQRWILLPLSYSEDVAIGDFGTDFPLTNVGSTLETWKYTGQAFTKIQYMSSGGGRWMSASNAKLRYNVFTPIRVTSKVNILNWSK